MKSIGPGPAAASVRCLLVTALLSAACLWQAPAFAFDPTPRVTPAQGTVQAAFSPWDDVEGLLVATLNEARKSIRLQAYLLTSKKIATALIEARQRGVDVMVMADAAQRRVPSEKLSMLAAAGIPVWLETRYENAHNKIILIDAAGAAPVVITGSFNFTWTAQHKNAENVLILRNNMDIAAQYMRNWDRHLQQATAYPPPP